MKQLELLKAKIELLLSLPDYCDAAQNLKGSVHLVEISYDAHLKLEMDKFSKGTTDMWVDIVKGGTKFAVFNGKAYKISATALETIPQGEKTLYITETSKDAQP